MLLESKLIWKLRQQEEQVWDIKMIERALKSSHGSIIYLRFVFTVLANLGDIYDAVTDKFTAVSSYKEAIPKPAKLIIAGPTPVKVDFKLIQQYSERSSFLGLDTTLETSAYVGLWELDGRAQAARAFKIRNSCVNVLLTYSLKKGTMRLNTMSSLVEKLFMPDAYRHVSGTHVVIGKCLLL